MVDLVPDRLQHLAKSGALAITTIHQLRYIGKADIAAEQLFVVENT